MANKGDIEKGRAQVIYGVVWLILYAILAWNIGLSYARSDVGFGITATFSAFVLPPFFSMFAVLFVLAMADDRK